MAGRQGIRLYSPLQRPPRKKDGGDEKILGDRSPKKAHFSQRIRQKSSAEEFYPAKARTTRLTIGHTPNQGYLPPACHPGQRFENVQKEGKKESKEAGAAP